MALTKRVALYTRVSTGSQTTENQDRDLREVAGRAGWQIVRVYSDQGISGAKGRAGRPEFDAMCRDAARRRFDLIASWSVDRLGRSLHDLLTFMTSLNSLGVDLFLFKQALDTSTPAGRASFQMLALFAELERGLLRERVISGLDRARSQGKRLGRPRLDVETESEIRDALSEKRAGIRKIAAHFGVGVGTVQRISRELTLGPAADMASATSGVVSDLEFAPTR